MWLMYNVMRPWYQKMEAKLSFSDTTLSPPPHFLPVWVCVMADSPSFLALYILFQLNFLKTVWQHTSTRWFKAVLIPGVTAHQRSNSPQLSFLLEITWNPPLVRSNWCQCCHKLSLLKKNNKISLLKHTGSSERPEIILSASAGRMRRVLIILKTKLLLFTTWWQCNCGHLHFLNWLKQIISAVKTNGKKKKENVGKGNQGRVIY